MYLMLGNREDQQISRHDITHNNPSVNFFPFSSPLLGYHPYTLNPKP